MNLGAAGKELEELVGTEMAASMIAFVNMGEIPDFHNMDNAAVLDDIKVWAEKEKAKATTYLTHKEGEKCK